MRRRGGGPVLDHGFAPNGGDAKLWKSVSRVLGSRAGISFRKHAIPTPSCRVKRERYHRIIGVLSAASILQDVQRLS
jgi:hypothetical protein